MPSKPPRPCRAPACGRKTTAAHGYCEDHAHLHKPWGTRKGSGRGGRPWRRKRDHVLQRDKGLCQPCLKQNRISPATQVDHITPVAEGGTDADSNLQAICKACHDVKTQAEAKRAQQG
ncbi:HNH endonuclease [Marinobacterium iners]|uniref:HNH endonuclease n=1 Tax=Marinobacterium iners TaxID=48076 RepID=UPI001A8E94EF|nr:HNH endonuclease [Marinobacterium iners]QSR35563.1 HNH endonuclease [Marinobacterium iners]